MKDNKVLKKTKYLLISLLLIVFLSSNLIVSAESYLPHKQNTDLEFSIGSNFATTCELTHIKTPTKIIYLNQIGVQLGQDFFFNIEGGNYSELGTYCHWITCEDGTSLPVTDKECFEITATGKVVEGVGQISVGIIYFFLALGFGLIALGYAFLNSQSVFVKYTGLIMMFIGGAFIYYDLHLSNLYATTIAEASGAGNVTSGAFLLVLRFIKLAPYLVAGVVAFSAVKLLREALKNKSKSDGWDYGDY